MLFTFTKEEKAEIDALEDKYEKLLKAAEEEEERLQPPNAPNTDLYFVGISPKENPEEWEEAVERENKALDLWEKTGSEEWKASQAKYLSLITELNEKRENLYNKCEKRAFDEITKGDLIAIIDDFKKQVIDLIKVIYDDEKRRESKIAKRGGGAWQSRCTVSLGNGKWKLYPQEVERRVKAALHLHYEAVIDNDKIVESFNNFIAESIATSEYVDHTGVEPFGRIETAESAEYRTKAKAGEVIERLPHTLAIPTLSGFQYATSLHQEGNAYLQPLKEESVSKLKFKGGRIYFDSEIKPISEVELQNIKTKEGITEIDLPLLRTFYSIILAEFEKTNYKEVKDVITLYIPDFSAYLGMKSNPSKKEITSLILKAQTFHNIIGVLNFVRNGKPAQSLYPVLNFEGYNEQKNTISFSSPYMNWVIREVYNIAVRKDKKGVPKLKKNGDPIRLPSHSYLVKSEINNERNKAAVENVFIICTLIEQAGNNIPRIKANTIIERNPQLAQRLESSTNPGQLLKTCFTKTWELLKTKTLLEETYNDIVLPNPKDPATIPTMKSLDIVFQFPHNGKKS